MRPRIFLLCVFTFSTLSFHVAQSQIKVNSNGNIGIGEDTPNAKLHLYGSGVNFEYTNDPFKVALYAADPRVQSNDKIVFYNLTNTGFIDVHCKTLYEHSDVSAKENIRPVSDNALEKIKQLNPVTYNWKTDVTKKQHVGFIAQEVEAIMPEVVQTIDSTGVKQLSYSHIVPYLVEAIQEQEKLIESQAADIAELKRMLSGSEGKRD